MSGPNGDTNRIWKIDADSVRGLGSFHKTLPHNKFGEVEPEAFAALVSATRGDGSEFSQVPGGPPRTVTGKKPGFPAQFTNPQAGLATDRLTHPPIDYRMPPAPHVMSNTTAAEMVELYWMARLRDVELCTMTGTTSVAGLTVAQAVKEINKAFQISLDSNAVLPDGTIDPAGPPTQDGSGDRFIPGVDIPGSAAAFTPFTDQTLFRLGLPGDDIGPMISQFFVRPAGYGTQMIDQRERPYVKDVDYLTQFNDWLDVQNTAKDQFDKSYPGSNEGDTTGAQFEKFERYIATMRDLARFVNKDALHQAYFTAALILLSGGAKWGLGNPYHDLGNGVVTGRLPDREAGFGVLGGPHLLALVSEVATRALKVVWQQKWQQHLRLRPEAYGGLLHVQEIGAPAGKRAYGLPNWLPGTVIANHYATTKKSLLLPMAFTAGSPTHPAYGAGHATVAGACVTVLKAWFLTFMTDGKGDDVLVGFKTLVEPDKPYDPRPPIQSYCTTVGPGALPIEHCFGVDKYQNRTPLDKKLAAKLTIEGELNKLAQNVAMGRTMGGVHWRTDNTRSLILGEALAAEILAGITTDANEKPSFTFRTFARKADGKPKKVLIERGRIFVDGVEREIPASAL